MSPLHFRLVWPDKCVLIYVKVYQFDDANQLIDLSILQERTGVKTIPRFVVVLDKMGSILKLAAKYHKYHIKTKRRINSVNRGYSKLSMGKYHRWLLHFISFCFIVQLL